MFYFFSDSHLSQYANFNLFVHYLVIFNNILSSFCASLAYFIFRALFTLALNKLSIYMQRTTPP